MTQQTYCWLCCLRGSFLISFYSSVTNQSTLNPDESLLLVYCVLVWIIIHRWGERDGLSGMATVGDRPAKCITTTAPVSHPLSFSYFHSITHEGRAMCIHCRYLFPISSPVTVVCFIVDFDAIFNLPLWHCAHPSSSPLASRSAICVRKYVLFLQYKTSICVS